MNNSLKAQVAMAVRNLTKQRTGIDDEVRMIISRCPRFLGWDKVIRQMIVEEVAARMVETVQGGV